MKGQITGKNHIAMTTHLKVLILEVAGRSMECWPYIMMPNVPMDKAVPLESILGIVGKHVCVSSSVEVGDTM